MHARVGLRKQLNCIQLARARELRPVTDKGPSVVH